MFAKLSVRSTPAPRGVRCCWCCCCSPGRGVPPPPAALLLRAGRSSEYHSPPAAFSRSGATGESCGLSVACSSLSAVARSWRLLGLAPVVALHVAEPHPQHQKRQQARTKVATDCAGVVRVGVQFTMQKGCGNPSRLVSIPRVRRRLMDRALPCGTSSAMDSPARLRHKARELAASATSRINHQ
jgi:hypothetical protein